MLVFILHGDTGDEDFYSDRSQNLIPKAAEKYKFMLVSVFGYHPNGGYNDRMLQAGGARRWRRWTRRARVERPVSARRPLVVVGVAAAAGDADS